MTLSEFVEQRRIKPVVDRCCRFEETPAAVRYKEEGHATGKIVITL